MVVRKWQVYQTKIFFASGVGGTIPFSVESYQSNSRKHFDESCRIHQSGGGNRNFADRWSRYPNDMACLPSTIEVTHAYLAGKNGLTVDARLAAKIAASLD